MADHQENARALLRAALDGAIELRAKEAGFVGQMAFELMPPSDKQARWLGILTERHSMNGEGGNV